MVQNINQLSQMLKNIDEERLSAVKEKFQNLQSAIPHLAFDNDTVTNYGGFAFLELFKKEVGFKEIVDNKLNYNRGQNTQYSEADMIDLMVDNNMVGNHRFYHFFTLANDPGYQRIKERDEFPDESSCRKVLGLTEDKNISEFKEIHSSLLEEKAKHDGSKKVWLSIDDTVSKLYGQQEKGAKGYNPKRKGGYSYREKVAFIEGSDELANASLYPGDVKISKKFKEFLRETIDLMPDEFKVRGILADKEFFSEDHCEHLEKNDLSYFIKAVMYNPLRREALAIPEKDWEKVSENFWVADKRLSLDSWDQKRRFVFIRKEKEDQNTSKQQRFTEDMETYYAYEAIVTNMHEKIMSPEKVMQKYNRRATVENRIEELKNGFACAQNSQKQFDKNYAYMLIKMLAYNIFNWFKQAWMPYILANASIRTVRRCFLNIPANVVKRGGRKFTISLPDIEELKEIFAAIKDRMFMFSLRMLCTPT